MVIRPLLLLVLPSVQPGFFIKVPNIYGPKFEAVGLRKALCGVLNRTGNTIIFMEQNLIDFSFFFPLFYIEKFHSYVEDFYQIPTMLLINSFMHLGCPRKQKIREFYF